MIDLDKNENVEVVGNRGLVSKEVSEQNQVISEEEVIDSIVNSKTQNFNRQPMIRSELRSLMLYMPENIRRQFGCFYCEWRGTEMCPAKFPKGKPKTDDDVMPNGICDFRAAYLASFVKDAYPTSVAMYVNNTMWRKAILTTTMHQQQMKDMFTYQQLEIEEDDARKKFELFKQENQMPDLKDKTEFENWEKRMEIAEKEYNSVLNRVNQARNRWMNITNGLMFYTAKDMDREQPKKIDVTHTTNIQDMAEFIGKSAKELKDLEKEVIEGEFTVNKK